jgi:hypothetical protein
LSCQLSLQVRCQLVLRIGTSNVKENIHETLAAILRSLFHNPPNAHVISAPECSGCHRIRLFAQGLKSRATNYCWPDIVITQGVESRVVLEIEQTGIVSPAKIAGKRLPVSLSTHLCNEEIGIRPISISRKTTFIQVVNTASLQPSSRKLLQYQNLQADIRNILPLGCIVRYFLVPVVADEAPPFGTAKYDILLDAINDSLRT